LIDSVQIRAAQNLRFLHQKAQQNHKNQIDYFLIPFYTKCAHENRTKPVEKHEKTMIF
jgi:hypothetical protein